MAVSDYPEPLLDYPGPSGRVAAVAPPPPEKPQPRLRKLRIRPSFSDHATRMGRQLTRVGASFRFAGIIIMIGALLLAAQNALILGASLQEAVANGVPLEAGAGQNNSSANATFSELVGAGRFYSRISLATQFDLVGFCLLGVGLILFGRGSRHIELRVRATDDVRKVPRTAAAAGVSSGLLCFVWVGLTIYWRSALTGRATGDWSALASGFGTVGLSSNSGLPEGTREFLSTFAGLGLVWIAASALLLVASVALYIGGRAVRKTTGVKIGGAGWVVAAGVSMLGTFVFVAAIFRIIAQANAASASGGEPNYGDAFTTLLIGAAAKLVVAPLASTLGFLALVGVGWRIARFKAGKVLLAPADVEAIMATPSSPREVRASRGAVLLGSAPPATMVSLSRKSR